MEQDLLRVRDQLTREGFLGGAAARRFRRTPSPDSLYLQITNRCNLSCLHCHVPRPARAEDLPVTVVSHLIDEAAANGCRSVSLSGGEPLLHPEIDRILEHAASRLQVLLVSNGTLIDRRRAESLAGLGIRVQLSLDSPRREGHDRIRGRGVFEKVMHALGHMQEAGLGKSIGLSTTILSPNRDDLTGVISFAEDRGIPRVGFHVLLRQGRAAESCEEIAPGLTKEDHERFFRYVLERGEAERGAVAVSSGLSGFMLAPPERNFSDGLWCSIGKTSAVAANGDVFPCSLMMKERFRLGNVFRQDLMEIFRSEKMHRFCRMLEHRHTRIPGCSVCSWRGFCQAGCPGQALEHSGSVPGVDGFCDFRKRAYREVFQGILERHTQGCPQERIGRNPRNQMEVSAS